MSLATMVVPPMYEAQMVGIGAIEITARKFHQRDLVTFARIKSCKRKSTDAVATFSFLDLVALIDTRHALETSAS